MAFFERGKNQHPVECDACGSLIPMGGGILIKNVGGKRRKTWFVSHDGCPGKLPPSGWIYAFNQVGPDRSLIKVGMIAKSLSDRVQYEIGRRLFPPIDLTKLQVWASPTPSRRESEREVLEFLSRYVVSRELGLGKEVVNAPLDTVLESISRVTGVRPKKYLWNTWGLQLRLHDDTKPPKALGKPIIDSRPMPIRREWSEEVASAMMASVPSDWEHRSFEYWLDRDNEQLGGISPQKAIISGMLRDVIALLAITPTPYTKVSTLRGPTEWQ